MKQVNVEVAKEMVAMSVNLGSKQRAEIANQRLRELITYARENSPFFREKYTNLPQNYTLKDLPITNKIDLQENFDNWVTDRAVTFAGLTQHIRNEAVSGIQNLFLDQYTVISTSGSTGMPFVMLRDEYHNRIHGALIEQRFLKNNVDIYSPINNRIAAVIITKPGVSSYAAFLKTQRAIGCYGKNMMAIDISSSIEKIVEQLNTFAPTVLTGYPSALTALAKEQNEGRLHLNIKGIASSAEMLSEKAFEYISKTFGCPVINNYCMSEGGEIAMSNGNCPQLHLNDDWILVEPIDRDGNPSSSETYSDGALITDLSNYICPIIRYRVSDHIKIDASPCSCGCTLPIIHISGRIQNCFSLCGTMFLPYGLMEDLFLLNGVVDFQLARVEKDVIEVRLSVDEKYDFETVSKEVNTITQKQLTLCGIPNAKVRVSKQINNNYEKTSKRLVVVDEVTKNV